MLPTKSRGTGSKAFLRLLTHRAEKLGLYFAQTGLWRWHPHLESEATLDGTLVPPPTPEGNGIGAGVEAGVSGDVNGGGQGFWQLLPSMEEEEIFEQLGMEYVEPERRAVTV